MKSQRSVAPRRARPILGQPTYVAPRYHSTIWGRVVFLFLIVAIFGGVGLVGYGYWSVHHPQSASTGSVRVRVGLGDTVTSVANRLHSEGIVDNPTAFRLDARLHNLSAKLKAGIYTVRRNMSIDDMVVALTLYHSPYVTITIPEGYRATQIASVLEQHGISGRSFLREVEHPTAQYSILADKPKSAGLEGYLFPSTYKVSPTSTGHQFADFMVRTLGTQFTPAMRAQARARGLTVFDTLILASIVERETPAPEERPIVASVYLNRLNQHIGLYADPTIQYAMANRIAWHPGVGASSKLWWPQVRDTTLPSPYNTYRHGGLPPGPIANPGLASIRATISPASTHYLYFVAKGNGHHVFATTYAQQQANIQKYEH